MVKKITEQYNAGKDKKYHATTTTVGRDLRKLGFKGARVSKGSYIIVDEKLVEVLKKRYGLNDDNKEKVSKI